MKTLDKHGFPILIDSPVDVPEPTEDDLWKCRFVGFVTAIDEEKEIAVVEDLEGDAWSVEFKRLELLNKPEQES